MKTFIKFVNYSLAIGLVLFAIALAYVAVPTFGNRALIVRSGSMEPTIKTGDLIVMHLESGISSPLINSTPKYKEGDIIAFKSAKDANILTTHRVVSRETKDIATFYQTKGDANKSPDTELVEEKQVIGKSIFTVPFVGKLFTFAKTKQGFALLVLIPALLVILMESVNLVKELIKITRARKLLQEDPKEEPEKTKLLGPVGLRVLIPLVVGLMFFHNTFAFFSDSATSTLNTFKASATFPTTSPSPSPEVEPTPNLKINEFVANPGTIFSTEWIEIFNAGGSAVSLTGWTLADDDSHIKSLSALGTINPGSFAVLDVSPEIFNNSGGDGILLKDPSLTVIDSTTYSTSQSDDISRGRDVDGTGSFKVCTVATKGTSNNGSC